MSWDAVSGLLQSLQTTHVPGWIVFSCVLIGAAVFVLVLVRSTPAFANIALAVLTLIALAGVLVVGLSHVPSSRATLPAQINASASLPALACLDDLAGDTVLAACEAAVFRNPETLAAALSLTAQRIDLAISSDQAVPSASAMRRSLERDRYGLVAQVLMTRDGCRPMECDMLAGFGDPQRIVANMESLAYDAAVQRHHTAMVQLPVTATSSVAAMSPVPAAANVGTGQVATLPAVTSEEGPSAPTGKPSTIDWPTSSSISAVSIMTEPSNAAAAAAPDAPAAPKKRASGPKRNGAPTPAQPPTSLTPPAQ